MPDVVSLMYYFSDRREHHEGSNRSSFGVPGLSAQAVGNPRATMGADEFVGNMNETML